MKVGVWHNLPSGGAKRALHTFVRGLAGRGHSVASWCLSTADTSYLPLAEFGPERVVSISREPRVRRRTLDWLMMVPDTVSLLRANEAACRQCAAEMAAAGIDVLLANSCWLSAAPYILRHVTVPSVLYLQEPARRLYEAHPILPWVSSVRHQSGSRLRRSIRFLAHSWPVLAYRLQAAAEWQNAQAAGTILVNSRFSRETVIRIYGRDATVCYLGVDTDLFANLHRPRENFVVGLGAVHPTKGIDDAVRAIALLPAPRPPLVWVANLTDSTYLREVTTLARALDVTLDVRVRVSDAVLVELLNSAALMIYTSHLEPFGLAPLEAGACGTPVVAVAEGGVRESIIDNVTGLLSPRDPTHLATAARRLLTRPALARQLGESASDHVRTRWTWGASVQRLERHLVGSRKREPS